MPTETDTEAGSDPSQTLHDWVSAWLAGSYLPPWYSLLDTIRRSLVDADGEATEPEDVYGAIDAWRQHVEAMLPRAQRLIDWLRGNAPAPFGYGPSADATNTPPPFGPYLGPF